MDDSDPDTGAKPVRPQIPTAQRPAEASRSDALALARLLAARLCHDIGGLAGTLAGAVDIAQSGTDREEAEALALAAEAASGLAARLRLLRAAWAGEPEALRFSTLREFGAGLGERVALDLAAVPAGTVFPAALGRVVLNSLLLAAQTLPRGGEIALAAAGPDLWMVLPRGSKAAWPAGFAAQLTDSDKAWTAALSASPRSLQAPLLVLLAAEAGIRLSFAMAGPTEGAAPLVLTPL